MDSSDAYIEALPEDRKSAISKLRSVILDNLPSGYEESFGWGMIVYQVPLSLKPDTYNGKPLQYAALASQKNHMAIYLSAMYSDAERAADFERRYRETGKRFDVGKSCVRFKKLDDLPIDLIAETIAAYEPEEFIELYETARSKK